MSVLDGISVAGFARYLQEFPTCLASMKPFTRFISQLCRRVALGQEFIERIRWRWFWFGGVIDACGSLTHGLVPLSHVCGRITRPR